MTTWFISRHPGALQWMRSNNIHFDRHLTHFSNEPIAAGDIVIGSLPVQLAADICARGAYYWNLSLLLTEDARGRELSADDLNAYQARLEPFSVTFNKTAPNPRKNQPEAIANEPVVDAPSAQEPVQINIQESLYSPSKSELYNWHNELFKCFIFNQNDKDTAEQKASLKLEEIANKVQGNPVLMENFEKTCRQGRHAVQLTDALHKKIKAGEPIENISAWLENIEKNQSRRISRHLTIELDKINKYRQSKRENHQANKDFQITLPYTQLIDGLHPQSIRAMKPAQEWDIYIDETGTKFGADATELSETDHSLGRIIALALPVGHNLAPLEKPIHSVDLTHEKIQELLKTITNSKCGILGATLKQDLHSYNWMSAVHQLSRWLLLMLPMQGQPTRVRIHIEQRQPYTKDEQLLALQDTLASELKKLLPARFENLILTLHIMHKDNPYNGYVDAIANCWGSPAPIKRQLLARTGWRGHCLLQTEQLARIEDIYRSISSGEEVSGYHWFELCAASIEEPPHSLLHDMLKQLGQRSSDDSALWSEYLQETKRRIERKDFTPASLQTALEWLYEWQLDEHSLPAHLQLELYSMQLASSNHQGATHLQLVQKLLPLINQLTDESPAAACQAVLRIAVRSTHLYDFSSSVPLLQQWLDYPIAVPGLLNHAKLQSTMGQLLAFQGQHQDALGYLDQALQTLERLSDTEQKLKDSQQTSLYRAVILQDMQHAEACGSTLELVKQATKRTDDKAIEYLARSGSPLRFVHYLLLRLLISQPELIEQRQVYLAQQDNWQSEHGHPWMLIEAYRAWLLQNAQQTHTANERMQLAVNDCINSNQPMLVWMGYCLQALASSLGLSTELPTDAPEIAAHYPADQLGKLNQATSDAERLELLQQLLPFNFH